VNHEDSKSDGKWCQHLDAQNQYGLILILDLLWKMITR
jgi:hypothetical protein